MKRKINIEHFRINEGDLCHYGADQYWYPKKTHSINGCGPTTAALITRYMASAFADQCAPMFAYPLPPTREDFAQHMSEVREYVRPGLMGLTDHRYFIKATREFAKSRGVVLRSASFQTELSTGVAFGYIKRTIDRGYMPALLILRNPYPELDDFTWHWMAITGYDDEKQSIIISTYAKAYELDFEKVWHQVKPYRTACVYFYPK